MKKKAIICSSYRYRKLIISGKHFKLSLLALLFPLLLFSQSYAQEVVNGTVYLKNGSVIRGEIVELVQDSIVKMRILKDNIFVFKWEDIDKMVIGDAIQG